MSKLTDFLLHEGKTDSGLHFSDVIYMKKDELETTHDYIQWIFPLPEPSRFVPGSPVLTQEEYDALHKGLYHLDRLVMAKGRFLTFLDEYDGWMVDIDHNHARISRVLKCLSLFRGLEYSSKFWDQVFYLLARANKDVSQQTKNFWQEAIHYRENQRTIRWK